jgi:hypothetical protein
MSMIVTVLQPDPDGSIRLPLPRELRNAPVKVAATLEPASAARPRYGFLAGKIELAPDFDEPSKRYEEYTH